MAVNIYARLQDLQWIQPFAYKPSTAKLPPTTIDLYSFDDSSLFRPGGAVARMLPLSQAYPTWLQILMDGDSLFINYWLTVV